MFITGVMLMLCVGLCGAIECDLTKQYPVRKNSSGPILKCSNCRECAAGSEPRVPCGKIIDIYKSIGDCKPCRNGTYSPNKDTKQCQTCRRNRCFKHQVIEGECVTDKHDASYCLDKCEKGYIMNKEGTACIVDFFTTIPASIPTTIPATNSTTTKKLVALHDRGNKKSRLHPAVIAVLVLVCCIVVVIVVYCCCEKLRGTGIRGTGTKDDEKLDSTVQLMDKTNAGKKDETVKFGTEEVSVEQNGSPIVNGSHSGSTERLENNFNAISNTPPQNPIPSHIVSDINRGLMASTPPSAMSNAVAFETLVNSPADMFQEPPAVRMAPPLLLPPITPTQSPMYRYVPNNASPGLWRFDDKFPFEMYNRICETFDYGPVGKNWRALAGWLKLNLIEVRRIEGKEYKTREIIPIWAAEDGNGVDKFIQILIDNKVTSLVGDIKACRPQIF